MLELNLLPSAKLLKKLGINLTELSACAEAETGREIDIVATAISRRAANIYITVEEWTHRKGLRPLIRTYDIPAESTDALAVFDAALNRTH